MKKTYESPKLFIDEYAADTMIASANGSSAKNGNPANNQNCWGCNEVFGKLDPNNPDNVCLGPIAFC